MIGEVLGVLNGWIEQFGLLSEGWRAGVLVFLLVLGGTAAVAILPVM